MASVLDLGVLCQDVYEYRHPGDRVVGCLSVPAPAAAAWVRLESYGPGGEVVRSDRDSRSWRSGFFAALYERATDREHVLAVRGTDGLVDWLTSNATLARGLTPDQHAAAQLALAQALDIVRRRGKTACWLTGHSLGGGLAYLLSAEFGYPLVTFNAPQMLAVRAARGLRAEFDRAVHALDTHTRPAVWRRADGSRMRHVRAGPDIVSHPKVWAFAAKVYGVADDPHPGEVWTVDLGRVGHHPPAYPDPLPPSGHPDLDGAAMAGQYLAHQLRVLVRYRVGAHYMAVVNKAMQDPTNPRRADFAADLPWLR